MQFADLYPTKSLPRAHNDHGQGIVQPLPLVEERPSDKVGYPRKKSRFVVLSRKFGREMMAVVAVDIRGHLLLRDARLK